jgi:hypothetical protein
MVSQNTVALLTTGGAGAVGVAQFIAVKQLVDKNVSVKPLGSFSSSIAKGLNEWTTIASLAGGLGALAYVLFDVEYKGRPLSDVTLALGSYAIVSLTAGIINTFLDPLGSSGVSLNLSSLKNLFNKGISSVESLPNAISGIAGKFVR